MWTNFVNIAFRFRIGDDDDFDGNDSGDNDCKKVNDKRNDEDSRDDADADNDESSSGSEGVGDVVGGRATANALSWREGASTCTETVHTTAAVCWSQLSWRGTMYYA